MKLLRTAGFAIIAVSVAAVLFIASQVSASGKETGEIDTIVKDAFSAHHISSLVATVIQNGKITFQKAYGVDPLFPYAENAPSNPYALGPLSQVLTGAGVLILNDQGKLSLEEPVSTYLPGLPEAWRPITIGQLLTHRSGLPAFPKTAKTFDEAVQEAAKQPLRFKPGSQRGENSADYDMLGQVIEKVTGQKYIFFMEKTVFKQMKFVATGDFSMLLFRFVAPTDTKFNATTSTQGAVTVSQGASASTLTGHGGYGTYDPMAKARMMDLLTRNLPPYSVPSRGLASNMQDVIRIATAIFEPGAVKQFTESNYLALAPGWKGCDTGKDTMLTAAGLGTSGYNINVKLLPSRKVAVILLWRSDKATDNSILDEESQNILESALGIPVSNWVCTGGDEDQDDDQQ